MHDDSKTATGVHLKVLNPDNVNLVNYEKHEIPDYDQSTTVILFPDFGTENPSVDISTLKGIPEKLIVIDCKWTKTGASRDEGFKGIKR